VYAECGAYTYAQLGMCERALVVALSLCMRARLCYVRDCVSMCVSACVHVDARGHARLLTRVHARTQ
jgi:hypothetical protein